MTSYRLSELPTPGKTVGMPAGCVLGEVEPPTPTGTVFFSGSSVDVQEEDGLYLYSFDVADGDNADTLRDRQLGDELVVAVNGSAQTLPITMRVGGEPPDTTHIEMGIGELAEEVPVVSISMEAPHDIWLYSGFIYVSLEEIPGGVTLEIADPA